MNASRPATPVVINSQRQRLAVVALLLAVGTPFGVTVFNLFTPSQSLSGITILVGLGLLCGAVITGAVAIHDDAASELPYRFLLMGAMAVALAPGVAVGTILGLSYASQHAPAVVLSILTEQVPRM